MQLIILGTHESDALRQILHRMGAYHELEEMNISNSEKTGNDFVDIKNISELHREMIRAGGADWDAVSDFTDIQERKKFESRIRDILSDLDAHRPWMISDPGLCLLFPVWRKFLEVPVCIHVIGSPIAPARFLNAGGKPPIMLNIALWEKYNLAAFRASAGLPRTALSCQALMTDPVKTVTALYESLCALGVRGLRLPDEREISAVIGNAEDFWEKEEAARLDDYINASQKRLYEMLRDGSLLTREANELPSLSAGAEEILRQHDDGFKHAQLTNQWQDMANLRKFANADVAKLAGWVEMLDEDICATYNSATWKTGAGLTGILRKLLFIKTPTAREHIENILGEFRNWKTGTKHPRKKTTFSSRCLTEKKRAITSFYTFIKGGSLPRWPLEIYLEISNVCDIKCAMCATFSAFNSTRLFSIREEERGFLSEYTALEPLLRHSLRVHCFGYGEPTIHPKFQEIIRYISDYEVPIDFFTNGMHLTEQLCELLVEKHVYRVVFSFSGVSKEEYENIYIGGNYEKVLAGLSRLADLKVKRKAAFPEIEVNCMGFQHQLDRIVEFVDLMAGHGVNAISLKPVDGFSNIPQLHAHIAMMRPWVEGKLLEKAGARAKERGLHFDASPFINASKVTTAEEVELCRKKRIAYATQGDAAESFIPVNRLRAEAEKIKPDKPPVRPRESAIQPMDAASPQTKDAMRDCLDIRAPEPALDIPCCEPFKTFYVKASGSVKPCCFGLNDAGTLLGDVNRNSAEEIWRGMGFQAIQEAIPDGQYSMKICRDCIALGKPPEDHYVGNLVDSYGEWFREVFGQVFDRKLWKKSLKLEDSKKIIDRRR